MSNTAHTRDRYMNDRELRNASFVVFLGFIGFLVWAMFAQLDQGISGMGTVSVREASQVVQHLEGGIIQQINIKEGDQVNAGDVLLSLTDASVLAKSRQLRAQYASLAIRKARLSIEMSGIGELTLPEDPLLEEFKGDLDEVINIENRILENRARELQTRVAILNSRIERFTITNEGLRARTQELDHQIETMVEELENRETALKNKYGKKSEVNDYEVQLSSVRGTRLSIESEIAATEAQIAETKSEIQNVSFEREVQTIEYMSETQSNLDAIIEQIAATDDIIRRTQVVAPMQGRVFDLQYHTIGGVVPPAKPILTIIPSIDEYIIKTRFGSDAIDDLFVGQEVRVEFYAIDPITHPSIPGTITQIGADANVDQRNGFSFFTVEVKFDADDLDEEYRRALRQGLPVNVFTKKSVSQTPFQYFFEPLYKMIQQGMRS